jgi:hypothetical protein
VRLLKQSTARNIDVFMALSSDGKTGATGKTLTVAAGKNGGSFASISPTVTETANGFYTLTLTTSHTDTLGDLKFHVTAADCDPSDFVCQVYARTLDDLLPTASYTAPDNATIATGAAAAASAATSAASAASSAATAASTAATINTKVGTPSSSVSADIAAAPAAVLAATVAELSAVPAASPTLAQALALLYMALRNKLDVTAGAKTVHTNAGAALGSKTLTDDGTTYSEAKMA